MNTHSESARGMLQAWIGLVHVKPRPGNEILGRAGGAFVPAIALARSGEDFVSKVVAKLVSYEFDILEIKDIEPCATRFKRCAVAKEVIALVSSLSEETPVALHTFQAYEGE